MKLASSDQRLSQPTDLWKLSFRMRPALLLMGMLASMALSWGCSGVVRGNVFYLRDDQPGRGWQWSHRDLERDRRSDDGYQRVGQLHLLWFGKRDLRDYSQPHRLHIQSGQPNCNRQRRQRHRNKFHGHSARCHVFYLRDDQPGCGWQWSHRDLERDRRSNDGYQRVGQLHLLWFGKRDLRRYS